MNNEDALRPEYPADLIKSGVRGKYAKRYREGTNFRFPAPLLIRSCTFPCELYQRIDHSVVGRGMAEMELVELRQ
jgi:hypothetical protein